MQITDNNNKIKTKLLYLMRVNNEKIYEKRQANHPC